MSKGEMMRRGRVHAAAAAVCGLALLVGACGSSNEGSTGSSTGAAAAPKLVKFNFGYAPIGQEAFVKLGLDKGIFRQEGLDLKLLPVASGAAAVAQLVNGQLQAAYGGVSGVIAASAKGIGLQIVAGGALDYKKPEGSEWETLVRADSGINSFKDLAGKTVALNSLNCCWHFWVREVVAKQGGDPKSVKFVQIPFADQVAAAKKGRVDAVTTLQPFGTELKEAGFKSLGDPAAIAQGDQSNGSAGIFMDKKAIEQQPEVVARFKKALAAAAKYANDHPAEVRQVIVKETGAPAALIDKAPIPVYTADVTRGSVEHEAGYLVKYGVLDKAPPFATLVWSGASVR
jgi:NitT/TauT family transport system substrate-binding protein